MDMISITVIFLIVCLCIACVYSIYKLVDYRDSNLESWTEN